jgi:hypothetical protein
LKEGLFTTYFIPEFAGPEIASNGKWLLFYTDKAISTEERDFLGKVAAALHADFDHNTIICSPLPEDPQVLPSPSKDTRLVISLGMRPELAGLFLDLDKPGIRTLETFSFILTLPIASLMANAEAKKELWRHMQTWLNLQTEKIV